MGSLDANYALLSDVSARNRALQARLRGSLPLLWTDNALVMTSAAPRRRRGVLHPFEPSGAAGEADQMLLALQGQASLQVSRRYKRRVEWEVARRIARVDRELQQYPPAQRFWNQKRREETPPRPRQRAKGAETGERVDVAGERNYDVKTTRVARVRRDSSDKAAANLQKTLVKPRVFTETSSNEKKTVKHVATSPLAIEREIAEDKENVTPNAVTPVTIETSGITMKEPLREDFGSKQSVDSKRLDDFYTGEVEEVKEEGEREDDPESKTNIVPSEPAEAQNDTSLQVRSSSAEDFGSNPRKDALASVYQASDADVASVIDETSPRRTKPQVEHRPSSSIGRQVLSDFRTMPSVASFGARPILPADGLGKTANTRLNADVLRRLFSDLDTDRDGHVNRIETCMALHRLQISVSTAKIISFFRHIHSLTEGNAVRSRNTQHLPMNEVINYKEFVAFVTAAFDKQQQQKSQRSGSQMRRDKAIPLPVPSTSLPIYSHRTSPPKPKSAARAHAPVTREHEIRVYEMNEADPEQDVASLEERVIKEIPDLLISRMMAGATNKSANEAATSIVRRSLESLVGKESIDDQTVKEIIQELLRERLRNVEVFNDDEDVTGLKRAAAYYNQQMIHSDIESSSVADGSCSEDLVNWVDILTEEQVSGLVQQIWKDKQAGVHHAAVGAVEDANIENPPTDIPEDGTVRWIDEATDTSELDISGVAILEKTVQASAGNYQGDSTTSSETANIVVPVENRGEDAVSSTATNSRSYLPQTQFARAFVEPSNDSHELFSSVTSLQLLQQLRQQRRMHQNMPPDDEVVKFSQEPNGPNRGGETNAIRMDFLMEDNLFSSEDDCESASSQSNIIDQSHQHNHERDVFPLPTTETVLLTEKLLDVDESVSKVSSHEEIFQGSISASSSGLSSASDSYYLHGMYQEIDHLQLSTRPSRRRHPRRRWRALSVSGSSVPDSLCSAELSEGELSREEALELSDGEIFGECKRSYIKCKNATRGAMKSPDGEDNLHSSIESGELPFTMEIHAGFRRQLVTQSVTSSVESGEIEDGTVPG